MSRSAAYERFFREADKDGSGELSKDELLGVLKKAGYTKTQAEKFFRAADHSGDGSITLSEFLSAMGVQPEQTQKESYLRSVFNEFDLDGNGSIDKHELKKVFAEVGKSFTDQELQRMIQLGDADGDGKLDYEEFIKKVFGK